MKLLSSCLLVVFALSSVFNNHLHGQCPNDNVFAGDLTPPCPGTISNPCIAPGEYVTVSVVAGNDYVFSTCGDLDFNTDLTLYSFDGSILAIGIDECGLQSIISWTATFTDTVDLLIDQFPCIANVGCITVSVNCVAPCSTISYSCSPSIPDNCSIACELTPLSIPPDCPASGVVSNNFCLSNIGATSELPYTYLVGCEPAGSMPTLAADVWFSFTATSNIVDIEIEGDLEEPSVGMYQLIGDCENLLPRGCANGTGGLLSTTFAPLEPGIEYYLQISGGDISDQGNFNLKITSRNNCDPCLLDATLTVDPLPEDGVYTPGTTVSFCFEVLEWDQTSINWLHGVVPEFGPGWDTSSIVPYSPPSIDGFGFWDWYDIPITGESSGLSFGPGFFYESALGCDLPCNPEDPGENYGDNGSCCWTFCWDITVGECPPNDFGSSLNISIDTYADGESGSWVSFACENDPVIQFFSSVSCYIACNSSWNAPDSVCEGLGSVTLEPLYSNNGIWSGSGVIDQGDGTAIFDPSALSGYVSITYEIINDSCSSSTMHNIYVIPSEICYPIPAYTILDLPSCDGQCNGTVAVSGVGPGPWDYWWQDEMGNTVQSALNLNGANAASGLCGGIYTVQVRDADNVIYSVTFSLTTEPAPSALWISPGTVCANDSPIELSFLVLGDLFGTWTGTGVSGSVFNPNGLSGSYPITYFVGSGPCEATFTQIIQVLPASDPSWTVPAPICNNEPLIDLSNWVTGTPGGEWSGPGVSPENLLNPEGLNGTYSLTYTANPDGCPAQLTQAIEIVDSPAAEWTVPGGICSGEAPFLLSPTGSPLGTWSGEGITDIGDGIAVFNPNGLMGDIPVKYIVTVSGCSDSSIQTITVFASPDPSWAVPSPICNGLPFFDLNTLLTVTSGGIWNGPNISLGNILDPDGLIGNYNFTYIVSLGSCTTLLTQQISFEDADASGNCNEDCSPTSVVSGLTAAPSPTGTNVALSWNSLAGAQLYQVKGRRVGTTAFGKFITTNTFKNVGGLTPNTSYEWQVRAKCDDDLTISPFTSFNTFTTANPALKSENSDRFDIRLVPNPTGGQTNLIFDPYLLGDFDVLIVNVFGQTVYKESNLQSDSGQVGLNLEGFSKGMYFVDILSDGFQKTLILLLE